MKIELNTRLEKVFTDQNTGMCELACFRNDQKRRFYRLLLGSDLFGELMLIRQWGSLDSKRGNQKQSIVCAIEVETIINTIRKEREKKGYVLL